MSRRRRVARSGAILLIAAVTLSTAPIARGQVPSASQPAAAAASAPWRMSPALPLKRDENGADPSADRMLVAATVLLALALGAGYLLLRRNGGLAAATPARWGSRNASQVRSSGRVALSQHASVHVVQWGDEELLLGSTAQQVTLLAKRPLPAQAETARRGDAA